MAVGLITACNIGRRQDSYILIGVLLPLTGEFSDNGLRALNALYLAREEINARGSILTAKDNDSAGGILGRKLDIFVLNDRGDPEFIIEQYYRLVELGVAAIITSGCSGASIALVEEMDNDGTPVIVISETVKPNTTRSFYYSDFGVSNFVKDYFGSFAQMPMADAAAAYTSIMLLTRAIEKAGKTSHADIAAALKSIELDTALGQINYEETENTYNNLFVIQWRQ